MQRQYLKLEKIDGNYVDLNLNIKIWHSRQITMEK